MTIKLSLIHIYTFCRNNTILSCMQMTYTVAVQWAALKAYTPLEVLWAAFTTPLMLVMITATISTIHSQGGPVRQLPLNQWAALRNTRRWLHCKTNILSVCSASLAMLFAKYRISDYTVHPFLAHSFVLWTGSCIVSSHYMDEYWTVINAVYTYAACTI